MLSGVHMFRYHTCMLYNVVLIKLFYQQYYTAAYTLDEL